jgi:hypothetical protein
MLNATIAFAVNYIPFIGPLIATYFRPCSPSRNSVPWTAFVVCLNLIQFIVGSYFEPRIAGGALAISPFLVLFAVFFWTFLWRIAGAFIGVPIVIAALTLCEQHPSNRWIADRWTAPSDRKLWRSRSTRPNQGISRRHWPSGGRRRVLVRLAWPEGHDQPDDKHGRQRQEQHGLFEPRDRWHGDGHSDAQEADLQR